jgi:hypothetical protein
MSVNFEKVNVLRKSTETIFSLEYNDNFIDFHLIGSLFKQIDWI